MKKGKAGHYDIVDSLENEIEKAKTVCKDLYYPKWFIDKFDSCKSEADIRLLLKRGRREFL